MDPKEFLLPQKQLFIALFLPEPPRLAAHHHVNFISFPQLCSSLLFLVLKLSLSCRPVPFSGGIGKMVVICGNQCLTKIAAIFFLLFLPVGILSWAFCHFQDTACSKTCSFVLFQPIIVLFRGCCWMI